MSRADDETSQRAKSYANKNGITIDFLHPLGTGEDGVVWRCPYGTAIKSFYRAKNYFNERDCYFRLLDTGTKEIAGFAVPELVGFDSELMVIEIGIVTPPRVLDFGKAYLDWPADFAPETLAESMEQFSQSYSADDWDRVLDVVSGLRSIGIHYYDLKAGNIQVRPED